VIWRQILYACAHAGVTYLVGWVMHSTFISEINQGYVDGFVREFTLQSDF